MLSLALGRLRMGRHCMITHTHHTWQHLCGPGAGPQEAMAGPVTVPEAAMEEWSQLPFCSFFCPPQGELRVILSLLLGLCPRARGIRDLSDRSPSLCSLCG